MLGKYRGSDQHKALRFIVFVALAAIASTMYLTLEAAAWAALFLWVGALSPSRAAMLYSVSAITSYGHADVIWRAGGNCSARSKPSMASSSLA